MNFKKYIAIGSIAALGLIGCASSHPAPVAVNSPPPPPAVAAAPVPAPAAPTTPDEPTETPKDEPFKVTVNGASLTFPDSSWEKAIEHSSIVIVQNDDAEVKIMFAGTNIKETPAGFDKFVTAMVTKAGGKVVSTKAVKLGDVNAVFHDTTAESKIHIYVWDFAKNGSGWLIQCGSPTNKDAKNICTNLANTLAIE